MQEESRLIVIADGDNYHLSINQHLKTYCYNWWYTNDLMPELQHDGNFKTFTLTAGYANDLPHPDPNIRDDKIHYEGEYFYHLENKMNLVKNLTNLNDKGIEIDPREIFDMAEQHGFVFYVWNDNEFKLCKWNGANYIDKNNNQFDGQWLFIAIKYKNNDMVVLLTNTDYVKNECWSTFHWNGVTCKTCLNYFGGVKHRLLNPVFYSNVIQIDDYNLAVTDSELCLELFSFHTNKEWQPTCSVYRHREIFKNIFDMVSIDTPLKYYIKDFKIYFDLSELTNKTWIKVGLIEDNFPIKLFEYKWIVTKSNPFICSEPLVIF